MNDLGRYARGQVVPLVLAAGATGLPTATIYDGSGQPLRTLAMGPIGGDGAAYSASIRLGLDFVSGKFLVVYRFLGPGDVAGLAVAGFSVVGGGDVGGDVISLYVHDRPEARYVLGQLSGGSLVQGRNPHF